MELVALAPNRNISPIAFRVITVGQITLFIAFWLLAMPAVIPSPIEIGSSFGDLWSRGLVADLYTSLILYLQALGLATLFSLLVAYSAAIPFFRPLAVAWGNFRFFGMVGLPFLLTLFIRSVHGLKLALLTFSISVFLTTSMIDILDQIPKEKYDLARTLRMNEWQVLWEVQVLGRFDMMFDAVRQNGAIGWMMLPLVEGLWKSEGGIGALLDIQAKYFHLSEVAAIQIAILMLGLGQDYTIGVFKRIVCPYANLLLERR